MPRQLIIHPVPYRKSSASNITTNITARRGAIANSCMQAEAKAYALEVIMQAVSNTDPKVLAAITSTGMNPEQLIARSFQVIAERADKVGQLKISTELLAPLLGRA